MLGGRVVTVALSDRMKQRIAEEEACAADRELEERADLALRHAAHRFRRAPPILRPAADATTLLPASSVDIIDTLPPGHPWAKARRDGRGKPRRQSLCGAARAPHSKLALGIAIGNFRTARDLRWGSFYSFLFCEGGFVVLKVILKI